MIVAFVWYNGLGVYIKLWLAWVHNNGCAFEKRYGVWVNNIGQPGVTISLHGAVTAATLHTHTESRQRLRLLPRQITSVISSALCTRIYMIILEGWIYPTFKTILYCHQRNRTAELVPHSLSLVTWKSR